MEPWAFLVTHSVSDLLACGDTNCIEMRRGGLDQPDTDCIAAVAISPNDHCTKVTEVQLHKSYDQSRSELHKSQKKNCSLNCSKFVA